MASSGGLGLYIPEEQKWAPAYEMLKHFYNDIPLGSTRVLAQAGADPEVKPLAFMRPDGETMAVVLVNSGGSALEVDFLLTGGSATGAGKQSSVQTLDYRIDRLTTTPIVVPPRSVFDLRPRRQQITTIFTTPYRKTAPIDIRQPPI